MQAPNFRLMMSNIRVLIQLEAPDASFEPQPVEVSEVVRPHHRPLQPRRRRREQVHNMVGGTRRISHRLFGQRRIEHIVTNLVDNAIRFARSQVEVGLTRKDSRFSIHVWDDGEGVAAHYRPHVFDRGWTPAVARHEEKTSSGLGLYIAHTLSTRYGGDLTIESATSTGPDDNTAFVLTLPSHPAPKVAAAR